MRDRALILGATGMLGHACIAAFAPRFDVFGSIRDPDGGAADGLNATLHQFDALGSELGPLLDEIRPDVVVNCIGLVKQLPEAARPRASIELNSLFPQRLFEACEARPIRLIHISSDCVFSGRLPLGLRYDEDAPPDPQDLYGRSKLLGELPAPALTIRTSFIGPELQRQSGLLEWFRAQGGRTITGYRQAIFSGLTTVALAELLVTVTEFHPTLAGLYHVAAEPISKYDLLTELGPLLGVDCEIAPSDEPVINRALDPGRFTSATNIRPETWEQMLAVYRRSADVAAA